RPERATEEGSGSGRISQETRYLLPVVLPVVLAGLAAVLAAVWHTFADPPAPVTVAGVLALLAAPLFSEALLVRVERLPVRRLSPSTVFIIGAGVLYGRSAAVFVALLTRVTLEVVERRPRIRLYYNGAVFALAAGAAGLAMTPFHAHDHATGLFFEVLARATAFYGVDVLLIAAIPARWARAPLLPLLRPAAVTTAAPLATLASRRLP